jgi:hypothetical protein
MERKSLAGKRTLIAEDEPVIAMDSRTLPSTPTASSTTAGR